MKAVFPKLRNTAIALIFMAALLVPAPVVCAADAAGRQTMAGVKRASPEEQVIYTDINESSLGIKTYFDPDNGSDYFACARIDVADKDGYVCQAMVYVCRGSERYTEDFRQYLFELEAAYSGCKNPIAGYLDLWWDNRIRNWITYDFYDMQQVRITDPDGFAHDATVVAVCGSDEFMEQYNALHDQYMEEYENAFYCFKVKTMFD